MRVTLATKPIVLLAKDESLDQTSRTTLLTCDRMTPSPPSNSVTSTYSCLTGGFLSLNVRDAAILLIPEIKELLSFVDSPESDRCSDAGR